MQGTTANDAIVSRDAPSWGFGDVFCFAYITCLARGATPPDVFLGRNPQTCRVMHFSTPSPTVQVAAGSVVLRDLPPQTTAAGVPAKIIGVATEMWPSEEVDQNLKQVLYDKGRDPDEDGEGDKMTDSNTNTTAQRTDGSTRAERNLTNQHWRTARVRDIEKRSVL